MRSRSARRASTGRWCGARISRASPASRRRSSASAAVEGRKRFRGILRGLEDDEVVVEEEGALVRIPFASVRKAKLTLSPALLARAGG